MAGSYVELLKSGELERRVAALRGMLRECRLCPHECGVDRTAGELGRCRTGALAAVSSFNDHHGEEPPISGRRGSGTIFFTNCNLRCVFCQNYPISQLGNGREVSAEVLAEHMLALQERGCHNINWVTPSHVVPQAVEALWHAARGGLSIPIVYNCGGYESVAALKLLDGIVDVYLPDIKYGTNEYAEKYSGAPGYFDHAKAAVLEMSRQVGALRRDRQGAAVRGLLVRHLVLPGDVSGSRAVFEFLSREVPAETYISLMSQYFPAHRALGMPPLDRPLTGEEYERALEWAEECGLTRGWIQPYAEEKI